MHKPLRLEFIDQGGLEALWEGFPEPARREVTALYARLLAQSLAAHVAKAMLDRQEACDEPDDE
jgi:hypothetical protein